MKIVVCGPPHSGKSVFIEALRRRLHPLGLAAVIEGCPDGEGYWAATTDQGLVGGLREKGKFSKEFVDWIVSSIRGNHMPLVLVDVGGVRSSENELIFCECDGFIVLANPDKVGELEAWDAFGRANGCKPVALLESILHGQTALAQDAGDGILRGVQAGLERGERVAGPVVDALVRRLVELSGENVTPGRLEASVDTIDLANTLGIPEEERDTFLGFQPRHAVAALQAVGSALLEPICRLWGPCPSWLVALIAAAAKERVERWDIRRGWVDVPEFVPTGAGSEHLAWRVEDWRGRKVVTFSVRGQVLDPECLSQIVPPALPPGVPVVMDGEGPHWLIAAIARAYARQGREVAVLHPPVSTTILLDGRSWAQTNPGLVPAVVVAGPLVGTVLSVPVELVSGTIGSLQSVRRSWRLGSGEPVVDRPDSHFHRGMDEFLPEALEKIEAEGRDLILAQVDMGWEVGLSACVQTGPEDSILFVQRVGRKGLTRFVQGRQAEPCRSVVVILTRRQDGLYTVMTAYVGAMTEPEPWDSVATERSVAFWNSHALVWGSEPVVVGSETNTCPW